MLFFLLCCAVISTLVKRLIFFVFQILTFVSFQNFVCRLSSSANFQEWCQAERMPYNKYIRLHFYFGVIFFRFTQSAMLDGRVHGVVVHARIYASSSFTLKRTIAERSFTSLYPCATSCAESGVPQRGQ